MSHKHPKILLVDDEPKFINSIAERFKLLGFEPLKASSGPQALEIAQKRPIEMAIVDYQMPGMDGLVTITKLREINPDLKTVLLTGHGSEKVKQATEALNAVYAEKDRMQDFWEIIKKSSQSGSIIVINPSSSHMPSPDGVAPSDVGARPTFDRPETDSAQKSAVWTDFPVGNGSTHSPIAGHLRLIGETRPMQELRRNIERLAGLDCPVVIRGETGTGKELTARMIHNLSRRRQNRFTAVNCGCLSNDLFVEELFRSGAEILPASDRQETASLGSDSGGTLLLDQIEDLSPKMQLSMLKIIDSKKLPAQGRTSASPFDVRIMVSSQFDLGKLVEAEKFKDELYYRLNILELVIPPLRDRKDDIAPLCSYFIQKYAGEFSKKVEHLSEDVISTFMTYDFPGNVRELEHIIERAVILADGNTIEYKHLPHRFLKDGSGTSEPEKKFMTLAEIEKQHILEVMEAVGGNKSKATELLGISRTALWRKLKTYEEDSRQSSPLINEKPSK